jgi:hypothetical protein
MGKSRTIFSIGTKRSHGRAGELTARPAGKGRVAEE